MTRIGDFALDEIQKLEAYRMWNEGNSAAVIGAHFGKTRSSIIGLVHRAPPGVILRKKIAPSVRSPQMTNITALPRIKLPKHEPKLEAPEAIGPVGRSAEAGCQFMHGDPATTDWRMCGCAVHKRNSSWCEYHWRNHVRHPAQPERKQTKDAGPRYNRNLNSLTRWPSQDRADIASDARSASFRDLHLS